MKFTSEDLIKAKKALAEIVRYNSEEEYDNGVEIGYVNPLQDECYLISKALEELERLLPRPKRVGDLSCREMFAKSGCSGCPVRNICNEYASDVKNTEKLYVILESYQVNAENYFDQEIHDLLKTRLDKEME